jgi:hypothetical protein
MTVKRMWISLLATGLVAALVAVLAGPFDGGAQAGAADEPRATVRGSVTLAPGAFIVADDDTSFDNVGDELAVKGPSANGTFIAPVFFEDDKVRISSIILYAYDNGPLSVCLGMYRTTPADGNGDISDEIGSVCSTGTTTGIRSFHVTSWNVRRVGGSQGPYLELFLPGLYSQGYGFYGAKIVYTYDA